jgi:hypothetical protein
VHLFDVNFWRPFSVYSVYGVDYLLGVPFKKAAEE